MLDDMCASEWQEAEAMNEVVPIDHADRMLGYIAHSLALFFGVKCSGEELRRAFLPWVEEGEKVTAKPEAIRRVASRLGL